MRTYSRPPLGPSDYRVEDRGYESDCWIRLGVRNNKGYTKVTIGGKTKYAHRAMYEQEIGPIPDGLTIDHLCDQRDCIRPSHLEPKSNVRNLRRGRQIKLTPEKVLLIRASKGTTKEIGERFGISPSHCSRVRRGVYWSVENQEV